MIRSKNPRVALIEETLEKAMNFAALSFEYLEEFEKEQKKNGNGHSYGVGCSIDGECLEMMRLLKEMCK